MTMALTLDTYYLHFLEQMMARYKAETAEERHVAPLTPERFIEFVTRKSYFDPTGLFIAHERGTVVGWVHACYAPATETWHRADQRNALIRMLIFPRERLEVGYALVTEATTWLEKTGAHELLALHAQGGYPFYRGLWYGGEPMGPANMPHVQVALEVGGYKNTQESIFMTAELPSSPEARTVPGLTLTTEPAELIHEGMRASWVGFTPMHTIALLSDTVVGGIGWTVLPQVAEKLGAPCLSVWSMGVREEHRRKGIASALLVQAIRESYAQGARFGSVATQLWNQPAQTTYAKYGFTPHRLLIGRTKHVGPPEEAQHEK